MEFLAVSALLLGGFLALLCPIGLIVALGAGVLMRAVSCCNRYLPDTDPYELQNLLYPTQTADPGNLPTRLQELKGCAADTCRTAEDKLDAP